MFCELSKKVEQSRERWLFSEYWLYRFHSTDNKHLPRNFSNILFTTEDVVRDSLQISLLLLGEFKPINWRLFPLKSYENHRFYDEIRGNRS